MRERACILAAMMLMLASSAWRLIRTWEASRATRSRRWCALRGPDIFLRFQLSGDTSAIIFAEKAPQPRRRDNLWRATCFEFFARANDGARYVEMNFSSSGDWAAYSFHGYRDDMRPIAAMPPPVISFAGMDGTISFDAMFDAQSLLQSIGPPPWRVGLALVAAGAEGMRYWALNHPSGKPDFHNEACFTLQVPAPNDA